MNLADIDNLIERLEKKKSLRPGSPPDTVNGHLGVWRMVRHNRVFIELDGKGGLGKILVGPPSFVGHKLGDIPSEVWEALTPRATLKEFKNVKVSDNGVETLQTAIKNAVGPEDTRRDQVDSLKTPEQLVPIARSVGFTDDEIKQSLAGTSPNESLEDAPSRRTGIGEVETSDKPDGAKDNMPKASGSQNDSFIMDSLARAPEAMSGSQGDERNKKLADFLDDVIVDRLKKNPEEALRARRIADLANGLRAGKYSPSDVEDEIRDITENRARLKERALNNTQRAALEDAVEVKNVLDTLEERIDEKVAQKIDEAGSKFKPKASVSESRIRELADEARRAAKENIADAERQRADAARMRQQAAADRQKAQEFMSEAQKASLSAEAAIDVLNELAKDISNTEVKKEIKDTIEQIRRKPLSLRSLILKLVHILQILLLLIPGL